MTEYDKMLRGEVYNAIDETLLKDINERKDRCWEYNQMRPIVHIDHQQLVKQATFASVKHYLYLYKSIDLDQNSLANSSQKVTFNRKFASKF